MFSNEHPPVCKERGLVCATVPGGVLCDTGQSREIQKYQWIQISGNESRDGVMQLQYWVFVFAVSGELAGCYEHIENGQSEISSSSMMKW